MLEALFELIMFASKGLIIIFFIAIFILILIFFIAALAKIKDKFKDGRLVIKNINEKYAAVKESLLNEILPKKHFKQFLKKKKADEKAASKEEKMKHIYVLHFNGDIKASAVSTLREEITAILHIAEKNDEVILCLESAGGMVNGYGLAASELLRLRNRQIVLTIAIDKMAASGGYMMAAVADKIICAPFSIIGSIGVVVQLPNFHRYLQDKHVDFEQHTAGEYKRTISLFGENTEAGRQKLQQEIENIHGQFKQLIANHRKQINIQQVSTGEYWLGQEALKLNLVDELKTSDEYILECTESAKVYELYYEIRKPLLSRLSNQASLIREKIFGI